MCSSARRGSWRARESGLGSAAQPVAALRGRSAPPSPLSRRWITGAKWLKERLLRAEGYRGFTSTFKSLIRGLKNGVHFRVSAAIVRAAMGRI
jgi:hypothetical protein